MPPTERKLGFSQLRVGIFVLFGLAVLGFLILNATGDFNPFEKKLLLKARFANADGLREGAEVQLAGVHIGKVQEVKLLPPGSPEDAKIEAIMSVDQMLDGRPISERIRTDSTAQLIATSVLANDKLINVTPGTAKGTAVTENDVLDSTSSMSINQLTQTGNELLQQINKLAIPTNEILNKANQGEGTLGRVINDESLYNNLDAAVAETKLTVVKLQTTLDKVNRGDGSAGKLLNDPELYNGLNNTVAQLEAISKDIRAGKGTAGKLINDDALYNDTRAAIQDLRDSLQEAKPAIQRLNQISETIDLLTKDLNEGKGTAGKLLKDEQLYEDTRTAITKFSATADKFNVLLADAQGGKGTVGKLLTDETLYNNINQTASNINQLSSEGTKLIYDFRQNPKKFLTIQFKLF
ncbi:MAG: MlaD family protein [Acidobacteriota bacterium]|nr:MlaD family protein [Acidobacteriota bacterium]